MAPDARSRVLDTPRRDAKFTDVEDRYIRPTSLLVILPERFSVRRQDDASAPAMRGRPAPTMSARDATRTTEVTTPVSFQISPSGRKIALLGTILEGLWTISDNHGLCQIPMWPIGFLACGER